MTPMNQIHRIRDLYYKQGKSLKEIAKVDFMLTYFKKVVILLINCKHS